MPDQVSIPGIDYTVVIAANLMAELPTRIATRYPNAHAVILTDNRVWDLHGESLAQQLAGQGIEVDDIVIPEGEASKSLDTFSGIIEELHHHRFDQESLLLNVGGGVIMDLGGFVAASYRHGVRSVLVPTTLMAQQEAAYGDQVGINTSWSKNLIGTPSNPDVVYSDPGTLTSLRRRDVAAGLAATVRIAIAHDTDLFDLLEQCFESILDGTDTDALHRLVLAASTARLRNTNHKGRGLGVPFAHALEAACRYGGVLHGEALAWGIALATAISANRRLMNEATVERVFCLMAGCEMLPELPHHLLSTAVNAMDLGQRGSMVLPVALGTVTNAIRPSVADVHAALDLVCQHPAFCDIPPTHRRAA